MANPLVFIKLLRGQIESVINRIDGLEALVELLTDRISQIKVLKGDKAGSILAIQGEKGDPGDKGEPGSPGISIKGDKGDKGDAGESIIGPPGEKGEDGTGIIDIKQIDQATLSVLLSNQEIKNFKLPRGPKGDKGDPGKEYPNISANHLVRQGLSSNLKIDSDIDLGSYGLTTNSLTVDTLEGVLVASSGVVAGSGAINDLSDATVSSPSNTQVLKYDGVNLDWRNGFVAESEVTFTDITTNNASTSQHGFLPKLSGTSTQYLDGTGAYSTPSGIVNSYTSQAFSSQTSVTVTHSFGVYPLVQVIDGSGYVQVPLNIQHTSVNAFTVTFSSSSSGTIIATVGSPGASNVTTTATNYTTTANDKYVRVTASGVTITMVSSPSTGLEQEVKNDSSGSITVASSDNIDGAATAIVSPSDNLAMYYNGTEWTIR